MSERKKMNSEYEKRLEREIDRELKGLPELGAPGTLAGRVMRAVEQRGRAPWYRQSWQMWPVALRVGSLALLLALFGGICLAGWELRHAAAVVAAGQEAGRWLSGLSSIWNLVTVLYGALTLVVKQLGIAFVIACGVAVALAYAMCFGLGTVYVRLALARR